MRRLIAALALLVALPFSAHAAAIGYDCRTLAGVPAHVITVDLTQPGVKVSVAVARGGFPHANESFSSILSRTKPTAAINGTFFDKGTLKPIGDIMIDGRLVHKGLMGTALAITADNQAVMRRVTWGHAEDWTAYETVLACGPTLVRDGAIDLDPAGERFRDPHVLGAGCRSACGLTADGKLKLVSVTSGVRLRKLAEMMLALGCADAMNLDGGASTAMYYRGQTIVSAGRQLTNVLLAWENESAAPARDLSALPNLDRGGAQASAGGGAETSTTTAHGGMAAMPQTMAGIFDQLIGLAAEMREQGMPEQAQEFVANFTQSTTDDPAAQLSLGQALEKHGFTAEAKAQFEAIIGADPQCPEAAQARQELAKLQ